jgi:REP element-mobilizing transposase RayT
MTEYTSNIYNRHSIRLKGYDYAQPGLYFVTLCVQNRECLFGEIKNGEMLLNNAGEMIEKWCAELSNKFPDIVLDTYIIMPNHFHAIIVNTGAVGAHLRVRPDARLRVRPDEQAKMCPDGNNNILGEHINQGAHIGAPLHTVIQWFKTMTTNEYIRGVKTLEWQPFDKKLWQRNYYEHIIRNDRSYQYIANYIENNSDNWQQDNFFNLQ